MTVDYFINNWENIDERDIDFSIIEWETISMYQYLEEDFIRKFKKELNWRLISLYQKLTEDFIIEYKDYVSWFDVSMYQKLSGRFIAKMNHYIIPAYLKYNESLELNIKYQYKLGESILIL